MRIRVALIIAIVVAIGSAGPHGQLQNPSVYQRFQGSQWTCGFNALAATLTQCQAAPATGLRLYLTDIVIQTTTATSGTFAIQTGTGSNCATGTAALFPVSGTGNRFNAPINTQPLTRVNLTTPLIAPAASAICVIGVATNTVSGQLVGYTAP